MNKLNDICYIDGKEFFFESGVTAIAKKDGYYEVETEKGVVNAKAVVNAAGIYADAIHDMVCPHEFAILPRAGEYCLCDKTAGNHVAMTIFQMPSKLGKGILDGNFIEGMACVGGCINGAGCLTHGEKNKNDVDKYGREALEKTITDAVSLLK